jgi:hypothetical protein
MGIPPNLALGRAFGLGFLPVHAGPCQHRLYAALPQRLCNRDERVEVSKRAECGEDNALSHGWTCLRKVTRGYVVEPVQNPMLRNCVSLNVSERSRNVCCGR